MRTHRIASILLLPALASMARAEPADAPPRLRHVPPAEVALGEALRVTVEVERGWKLEALDLHWRRPGSTWNTTPFGKTEAGGWAAVVPAAEVTPPTVEYFITSRDDGGPTVERFASAAAPHPVLVTPAEDEIERQERLLRYRGNRSRARAVGEWVDFGSHGNRAAGGTYRDRYYRAEAEYLYRILTFVESIRLGVVRLRGDVPPPGAFLRGASAEPARATGMDYGYAEVALALTGLVGVTGRVLLGADDLGFATGAGASLRLGEATRAHLEVGGETIQRVGSDGFVRFAWDTVPRWPMSLTLHVTNEPAATRRLGASAAPGTSQLDQGAPAGVRAVWEVGYQLSRHVTLSARAGYQARVSTAGGPTIGAGLDVEW
jgi:hypothetical protein